VSSTIHAELTGKETLSEFEKLLDLEEELKDKCDNMEQQINKSLVFLILVTVPILGLVFFVINNIVNRESSSLNTFQISITIVAAILITLGLPIFVRMIRNIKKLQRNFDLDRKALKEVIGLLREVESVETKSPLERAYFRIKLSRFDIGY
jgi:hypothetical protein